MEFIKDFFQNQKVRTGLWNALGTFLGIVATYLGELSPECNIIIVPIILAITKYLNKKYL